MSAFPETQSKAQAAIDELLEGDRLPDYRDFEQLPYIQAIMLEVMRWGTAAPLCEYYSELFGNESFMMTTLKLLLICQ